MNQYTVPEISPKEFGDKVLQGSAMVILDVREVGEVAQVRLNEKNVFYAPISRLAYDGLEALPQEARDPAAEMVVICHHGVRSAQVTAWLRSQGWQHVVSLQGGLDLYALLVDDSIGRYYG
jgi:rhodanese-related sulfurtransferase